MTVPEEHAAEVHVGARRNWGDTAAALSRSLAHHDFPRGDLAALRRMAPGATVPAAFWRLAAEHDLLGNPDVERKWALIIHGIALMTPTTRVRGSARTANDASTMVGEALFRGGELDDRVTGFYSEGRLNRLLTARGAVLHTLLARMFRMVAASDLAFDWQEMAAFVLSEGFDEHQAENARRRIARAYYRAERRIGASSQPDAN